MPERIFLGLSAAIWLPYGVYCFLMPGALADSAGVSFRSATGEVELRAMYGGLQIALGAMALAGLLRTELRLPAVVGLAFATAGLVLARGVAAASLAELSTYTTMALVFEAISFGVAMWLLRRMALARV